ncbi:MAG TPA: DUF4440 domain-containing protein [Gemmatimonadaceae bacterium]|nr:DUF4440 domain-containing protein [Gemmatimonadaceae bacterium]
MSPRSLALATLLTLLAACATPRDDAGGDDLSAAQRARIAEEVQARLRQATDISAGGDQVARLMSVYPDSGRVVSAASGQLTTTRDSLQHSIRTFWTYVGQNMQAPEWRWGPMYVDVLGPNAAAVTATYRIAHLTPQGAPHVVGGAWTAVFARREGRWVIVQEHLSDVVGPASPAP